MTRQILTNIWTFCVLSAFTLQMVLLAILVIAYFNKNRPLVKSLLKWNLNIFLSFVFGFFTCMRYFIDGTTPHGESREEAVTVFITSLKGYALESALWALVWTAFLIICNVIYQAKVEHFKSDRQILLLYITDLAIMLIAIFIGVSWCYSGMMGEIGKFQYP